MTLKTTALIMAGGRGERFWPKSRKTCPKQFLSLTSNQTMLQETVERILPLVDIEDVFIATNQEYKDMVLQQLPLLPESNVLCEPVGKNTAPCIGLGAVHMQKKYGDAVMLVLPSDHAIAQKKIFQNTLKNAIKVATEQEALVTLGISPSSPDTGYGYVQYNVEEETNYSNVFHVARFVEKPNLDLAKEYVASGDYLWNSGMFVWRTSVIMDQIKKQMPNNYAHLLVIGEAIGTEMEKQVLCEEFIQMDAVSIDYGVLEQAKEIFILPASFGWDDVGSWLAVSRLRTENDAKNVVNGDVITIDTNHCIVQGHEKLIAMVGIQNAIVVDTGDALLMCDKSSAGNIRKVLEVLRACNRTELL